MLDYLTARPPASTVAALGGSSIKGTRPGIAVPGQALAVQLDGGESVVNRVLLN
jgi:hypothetical protein